MQLRDSEDQSAAKPRGGKLARGQGDAGAYERLGGSVDQREAVALVDRLTSGPVGKEGN
jgi:hypothetical protein